MARKKIAVKKKVVRKKVASGAAPPAARSQPAGRTAARPPKEKLPGEGVSIGGIIMLLLALALTFVVVRVFMPRDISFIEGYPFDAAEAPNPPRNLLREAEDKLIAREGQLTFTEAELNTYLNQRLKSKQGGAFASFVKMRGAYVDYEPDKIGVYVDRAIFGIPFVVSAHFEVYQSNRSFKTEGLYCTLGRVQLPKGRMFQPIMAPYRRLANACEREIDILTDEDVRQVKIDKDKVVIDF